MLLAQVSEEFSELLCCSPFAFTLLKLRGQMLKPSDLRSLSDLKSKILPPSTLMTQMLKPLPLSTF